MHHLGPVVVVGWSAVGLCTVADQERGFRWPCFQVGREGGRAVVSGLSSLPGWFPGGEVLLQHLCVSWGWSVWCRWLHHPGVVWGPGVGLSVWRTGVTPVGCWVVVLWWSSVRVVVHWVRCCAWQGYCMLARVCCV